MDHWWVGPTISACVVVIGWAVTFGRHDQKIKTLCKAKDKLEEDISDMKSQCGTIVGAKQCAINQKGCKAGVEKKLDERTDALADKLEEQTAKIHKRIDQVHTEISRHMIDISRFMGKVQGFMDKD